jgi:hypothetical protein
MTGEAVLFLLRLALALTWIKEDVLGLHGAGYEHDERRECNARQENDRSGAVAGATVRIVRQLHIYQAHLSAPSTEAIRPSDGAALHVTTISEQCYATRH